MTRSILLVALLTAGAAAAQTTPQPLPAQPGSTAPQGSLGAGTVNQPPGLEPPAVPAPGMARGRGERGEPNATVNAGVDRRSTTATTGMPIPFASVDQDENGFVDAREGQVLRDTGHDFEAADSDHDGLLSASEYQRMAGSRAP